MFGKPKLLTPAQMEEIRTKDFFDMILPGSVKFLSDHYGVGNLCAEILNGIPNGIADAGEYISKPVKHRFSPSFPEGL